MKMTIAGYDVDIKVKKSHEDRANKESLGYFLNYVALLAIETKMKWESEGYNGMANEAGRWNDDIDAELAKMRVFENI